MTQKKKIGDLLLEQGVIDKYQLKAALNRQERWGKKLGETLVEMGFITEDVLIKTLSGIFNIPSIKPEKFEISRQVLSLIPREVCERLHVIPLAIKTINNKKRFVVAMADPTDYSAIDEVQFLTNMRVLPMVTSLASINASITKYYGAGPVSGSHEISVVSKVSRPDEYMEIIRQGKEDRVRTDDPEAKEKVLNDIRTRTSSKPAESDFGKAIEDKLANFDLEETAAKPEPLAEDEYEESTGVFREDNLFNKLLKVLKNKSILSEGEIKVLLGVSGKEGMKQLKGSKGFKVLIELLHEKKLIDDKEKKLLEED